MTNTALGNRSHWHDPAAVVPRGCGPSGWAHVFALEVLRDLFMHFFQSFSFSECVTAKSAGLAAVWSPRVGRDREE